MLIFGRGKINEACREKTNTAITVLWVRAQSPYMLPFCLLVFSFCLGFQSCQACPALAQTQTASWYSKSSCIKEGTSSRLTASGKHFDENALTAASWDYPFGTRLRVINQNSYKWVEVVITDRGPARFLVKRGRVIDLSKMAFSKIADLKEGVIPIKIKVIPCQH